MASALIAPCGKSVMKTAAITRQMAIAQVMSSFRFLNFLVMFILWLIFTVIMVIMDVETSEVR